METYRRDVGQAGDGTVRARGETRHEEVHEAPEDEERRLSRDKLVLARIALGETGRGNGSGDARELAHVPAGELHAADVGVLREIRDHVRLEVQAASRAGICKATRELIMAPIQRRKWTAKQSAPKRAHVPARLSPRLGRPRWRSDAAESCDVQL